MVGRGVGRWWVGGGYGVWGGGEEGGRRSGGRREGRRRGGDGMWGERGGRERGQGARRWRGRRWCCRRGCRSAPSQSPGEVRARDDGGAAPASAQDQKGSGPGLDLGLPASPRPFPRALAAMRLVASCCCALLCACAKRLLSAITYASYCLALPTMSCAATDTTTRKRQRAERPTTRARVTAILWGIRGRWGVGDGGM